MSVLQTILSDLSIVVCDPALGGGTMVSKEDLSELLQILVTAEDDDLDVCRDVVSGLATEGRSITGSEWEALRAIGVEAEGAPVEQGAETSDQPPSSDAPPPAEPREGVPVPEAGTEPGADEGVVPV